MSSVASDALERRSPALPAALLAVLVFLVWGRLEGGFSPTRWGSLGIALIALLAVAIVALRDQVDLSERARGVSLAALGLFCAWNFLSILWADFRGDAWAAADVTLIYAAGFTLFALWRWTPSAGAFVLGSFVLGIAAIGAITLVEAARNPGAAFVDGRLMTPVGYPNGTAALWMSGAWPALFLAGSARLPAPARALALGACGFLVELAVLGQSRGWLVFTPLLLAAALLLTRQRLRLVLAALLTAAAAAAAAPRLLDVHDVLVRSGDGGSVGRAAAMIGATSGALCAAGGIWALADGRVPIDRRARLALAAAVVALSFAGLAGAAVAALRAVDDPGAWIAARWDEFTAGKSLEVTGSRFTASASSGRYDEWRIAWNEFVAHPVTGIGADNYAAAYLEQRRDDFREPRFPHSLELRVLSQLGVVGALAFCAFAAAALRLALRRRRRLDPVDGSIAAAALMVFLSWLVAGSVDWFWEIPALAAPALAFLALAGAVGPRARELAASAPRASTPREPDATRALAVPVAVPAPLPAPEPAARDPQAPNVESAQAVGSLPSPVHRRLDARRRLPLALRLTAGLTTLALLLAALVSVSLPTLAQAYEDAGVSAWTQNPALSYERLERAADFDPLSGMPLLLEGSIALRLGDTQRARAAFDRVLDREPKNWYANLQLAMLYGSLGQRSLAAAYLARAQALNPNDKVARRLAVLLERGKPIDPNALNDRYVASFERRPGTAAAGSARARARAAPLYAGRWMG